MAELTTAQKITEAETALHKLLTGTKLVQVGYGERRIQYTQANIQALREYIATLKGEADPTKQRRPMGVVW